MGRCSRSPLDNQMKFKKIGLIILAILGSGLITFFITGIVKVNVGTEYLTIQPTILSYMIMEEEIADSEILREIEQNNSLLYETCNDCPDYCVSCKTPLIAAVLYKRYDLAKEMIRKGAPVEQSIAILQSREHLNEQVDLLLNLAKEAN